MEPVDIRWILRDQTRENLEIKDFRSELKKQEKTAKLIGKIIKRQENDIRNIIEQEEKKKKEAALIIIRIILGEQQKRVAKLKHIYKKERKLLSTEHFKELEDIRERLNIALLLCEEEKTADTIITQLLSYKKLQEEYKGLNNEAFLIENFIIVNEDAFNDLGFFVSNKSEADNLLIYREHAFLTILSNRAIAVIMMDRAMQNYKLAMEKTKEIEAYNERINSGKPAETQERELKAKAGMEFMKRNPGIIPENISPEEVEATLQSYCENERN